MRKECEVSETGSFAMAMGNRRKMYYMLDIKLDDRKSAERMEMSAWLEEWKSINEVGFTNER